MAKKSDAAKAKPPVTESKQSKPSEIDRIVYQRNVFLMMALNMTWQLAVVVLVPIVGGYELDQHFHTSPVLTIIGFVVAALGVAGVLKRIVVEADRRSGYGPKGAK